MPKSSEVPLSNDQIAIALSPYGVTPSEGQISKIRQYVRILLKWNNLISLTSIEDPIEIVTRHFGESMYASCLLPVEKGRLADVGSGGGFPGLALKLICEQLEVILIESNKKKCAFLSEVIASLEIHGVEVLSTRFEDVRPESGFVDFVTARAVGGFSELLRWSKKLLSARGHVILWLGGEDAINVAGTKGWNWQLVARIPESQRRFILIGRPISQDPPQSNM